MSCVERRGGLSNGIAYSCTPFCEFICSQPKGVQVRNDDQAAAHSELYTARSYKRGGNKKLLETCCQSANYQMGILTGFTLMVYRLGMCKVVSGLARGNFVLKKILTGPERAKNKCQECENIGV